MESYRVIPTLLLKGEGLVKTVKFKNPNYVGDPRNAIRIFNEKEVDELVFLDITASREKRGPNFRMLEEIASECFMPVGYGGGIRHMDDVKHIFRIGIEKVIFNTALINTPELIRESVKIAGSQSVVASIDVKKNWQGQYKLYSHTRRKILGIPLIEYVKGLLGLGVGELIVNSVDRDGTYRGYELELVELISRTVNIPVIACGGAANLNDLKEAIHTAGASAVAAGSLFIYHGKEHKAVLINYPRHNELRALFNT